MAAPLIEDSIDIKATPEQVWAVISDLARMGEWSPQCKKMFILGGPVKAGTSTVNINRRGPLFWPTHSKVVVFEPNKELAFRVAENRTVWSFKIAPSDDGVTVTESRTAVGGQTTKLSSVFVDKLLGGEQQFESELTAGIAETLGKIKRAAEQSA
ncbi:MAG: SRPBCC family protein [Gordonia sp. (in: high G+C Gram-positive bacteria)]